MNVTLRQRLREIGIIRMIVLLMIAAIPVVSALAIATIALSGHDVSPDPIVPGNDTVPGGDATVTPSPSPMPTVGPLGTRIVSGANASPVPGASTQGAGSGAGLSQINGKAARHIAYAFQPGVDGLTYFSACWNVPPRPEFNGIQNHTIFLWTGIQQGTSGLVQAVLEWDHDDTGRHWTLACWIVNKRDGTYKVSPRINVDPGDRIRGEMRYEDDAENPGRKIWHIIMRDETHDSTTELVDTGGAVDDNRDIMVFSGVLEGIGYVYNSIDLPGDVTFYDITYRNTNGANIPVYLTGYVDPAFPEVAVEYEYGSIGTPVTIHTH